MEPLKNLISIIKELNHTHVFLSDKMIIASHYFFYVLSYQFDFANYALTKARKVITSENMNEKDKDCLRLYFIENAILAYSACYDKILQIIYFGFHIAEDFNNRKEYESQLCKCRYQVVINQLKSSESPTASELANKLEVFYKTERPKVNKYANLIKHKDGITIKSLKTYIGNIKIGAEVQCKKENDKYEFFVTDHKSFDLTMLYPEEIDMNECIDMLIEQNRLIHDFTDYLYHQLIVINPSINTLNMF